MKWSHIKKSFSGCKSDQRSSSAGCGNFIQSECCVEIHIKGNMWRLRAIEKLSQLEVCCNSHSQQPQYFLIYQSLPIPNIYPFSPNFKILLQLSLADIKNLVKRELFTIKLYDFYHYVFFYNDMLFHRIYIIFHHIDYITHHRDYFYLIFIRANNVKI